MIRKLFGGSTSEPIPVYIQSTTGGGYGGLVPATTGLVCEYRRQGQSTWTAVTLAAGTLGTWSSGGFIADGGLAGAYELGIPNAALAAGVEWVVVRLYGAANMVPVQMLFELDTVNYQSTSGLNINLAQAVAPGPPTQTVGGCLNGALANAAGAVAWTGTSYVLQNTDASTFRTWTTNTAAPSSGAPTTKT